MNKHYTSQPFRNKQLCNRENKINKHHQLIKDKLFFEEEITLANINYLISLLPSSYFDYTKILHMVLPSNTVTLNDYYSFTSHANTITFTICGIITDKKLFDNPNNATIQVTSPTDGNIITINIFNDKSLFQNLTTNMLVIFKAYCLKVNNCYEITLQNGITSQNELIETISSCKLHYLYLKALNAVPFNNFISLITIPILTRTISKYLVIIKQIFHITIEHKYNHNKIKEYPHLKLKAKILIDDGTSEALGYIYDNDIFTMLNLSDNENVMKLIEYKLIKLSLLVLYNKFYKNNGNNYITIQQLNTVYNKQYIINAIPFMNKGFFLSKGNTYINYINNKFNNNSFPLRYESNTSFINVVTYMERSKADRKAHV